MFKPLRCLVLSMLTLTAGVASADVITLSHTWTGTEVLQGTERYFRDGAPSVAGTAKLFPGTLTNIPTYFFGWDLDVMPGSVVSVTTTAGSAVQSFFSAGSTLVDPTDLAIGYLGDAGLSGPDITFSIDAPAGGTFWLIASSVGGTSALGLLAEAQVTSRHPTSA